MGDKQNTNNLLGKLSLLYFCIVGMSVFLTFSIPMVLSGLLRRLHPNVSALHYQIALIMVKVYIFLTPIKLKINNFHIIKEHYSKKSVLVANHRSHMDMFLLLANVFKLRAAANSYLFTVPLLGQVMAVSGHFKLEKGNIKKFITEQERIKRSIHAFDSVLFFPETTRCNPGMEGTQKFRLTPFKLAKESNAVIIPIAIKNTDAMWPKGFSAIDYSKEITIDVLPPLNVNDYDTTSLIAKACQAKIEKCLRGES
jgi:1-acyl-sn-glycerol-3-phosphate acyltransferase